MRRDAESASVMYLVKMPPDHAVPDPVPPVDQLSRLNTQRQPVPGSGGDLLPQDHQEIITGVCTPCTMRVSCVVLRGRDEIQARGPRARSELLRRQFAIRIHRMHMAVTAIPATSPGGYARRRELGLLRFVLLPNPQLSGGALIERVQYSPHSTLGIPVLSEDHANCERRVVLLPVLPFNDAAAPDFTCVSHSNALHDRARAHVVTDRARHDGLNPEDVECKRQPGTADLRRVAAPPELAPQRPSDLEPVRMCHEWAANLMRDAHPRLGREERVDLTPVVINWCTGQSAAANNFAALAVVRDPLVDTVEAPRVTHECRPLLYLLQARLLFAVPVRHLVLAMHEPQVGSFAGADRFKSQAHGEP
jgi:hypothetical protein